MSNLLNFITTFGTAAEMRAQSSEELTAKMREFGLTEEEMKVVLNGAQSQVSNFIKESEKITCVLVVPEEPDQDDQNDDAPDEGEKSLAV